MLNLEQCIGLTRLEGLETAAYGLLTTSEIVIVDSTDWKIQLRQKHRSDLDPSLLMKTFFADNSKPCAHAVLIYSHQHPSLFKIECRYHGTSDHPGYRVVMGRYTFPSTDVSLPSESPETHAESRTSYCSSGGRIEPN